MSEPPPIEEGALAYVLWLVRDQFGFSWADEHSILGDDVDISGRCFDEFRSGLADRYGPSVSEWPWHQIIRERRNAPTKWVAIPVIGWVIAHWLIWPRSGYSETLDVSIGQIAMALEAGQWTQS